MIFVTSSFPRSSVFKKFSVRTIMRLGEYKLLWFERSKEEIHFSVCGRPNRRNNAAFLNFSSLLRTGLKFEHRNKAAASVAMESFDLLLRN